MLDRANDSHGSVSGGAGLTLEGGAVAANDPGLTRIHVVLLWWRIGLTLLSCGGKHSERNAINTVWENYRLAMHFLVRLEDERGTTTISPQMWVR